MRAQLATPAAFLAASLAPAIVVTPLVYVLLGEQSSRTLTLVFSVAVIVAFLHTLIFGLVAAGWLMIVGKFRFLPMLVAGLVIGAVPTAVLQWPSGDAGSSSWANGVQTLNDGVPTYAGWLNYLQFVTYAGLLGAVGAIAFYLVHRSVSPGERLRVARDAGQDPSTTCSDSTPRN